MKGKLFLVSTPIGNLGDISFRAVEILSSVKVILAEDTRHTKKLLDHYDISTPLLSYRDQNHTRVFPEILALLQAGYDLALVSDAGTPLVSDPGFQLVREMHKMNIEVFVIPGASSVTSALAISGLPTDKFIFLGFLPKKPGQRSQIISQHMASDCTVVIFESPFRLIRLLEEVKEIDPVRWVSISKDLTKLHERHLVGNVTDVLHGLSKGRPKGEYVVCIAKEGFSS